MLGVNSVCVLQSQLQNVFSASGTGTTMDVNGTTIHDITAPSLWNGITYGQGSTGEVQGSQVLRNSGLQVRKGFWIKFLPDYSVSPLFFI